MARTKKEAKEEIDGGLTPEAVERSQPATDEGYEFAVNVVKLNRAKAWVSQNAEVLGNPEGAKLVAAVKERYIATGGLTRETLESRVSKPKNTVVNMADDDGSPE